MAKTMEARKTHRITCELPEPATFRPEPETRLERVSDWPVALVWLAAAAISWTIAIAVIVVAVRVVGWIIALVGV